MTGGAARHNTAALLATLLLAAVFAPHTAAAMTASELALYRQLAGGLASLSRDVVNNKAPSTTPAANATASPTVAAAAVRATPVAAAAAAAAAPTGATPAAVAKAVGTILAAASLDAMAAGTLGNPRRFKWVPLLRTAPDLPLRCWLCPWILGCAAHRMSSIACWWQCCYWHMLLNHLLRCSRLSL